MPLNASLLLSMPLAANEGYSREGPAANATATAGCSIFLAAILPYLKAHCPPETSDGRAGLCHRCWS